MSAHTHITLFFLFFSYLNGKDHEFRNGYRFSKKNRSLSSANFVAKLASRSVTAHESPIQVHQHYGLELHLILHFDNTKETCIRRAFKHPFTAQDECLRLKKNVLQGLCSCLFIVSRLNVTDKVEQCLKAPPPKEMNVDDVSEQKFYQDVTDKQTDVCSCRQVNDYYELIY